MVAVDEFRGHHGSVATDSLGGTAIGRVTSFEFTVGNNISADYQAGNRNPFVIGEGNRSYEGELAMVFRDITELLNLVHPGATTEQTADTLYVQLSTGASGTETVDLTIAGVKYNSHSFSFDNTGSLIEETAPFMATGVTVAETTN